MLPTSPRLEPRSTCSSWTAPCSVTATLVSCGVTLIRICSFMRSPSGYRDSEFREKSDRFVERQPHDPRVASFDALDEGGRAPLDTVGAGLVERLARRDIGRDAIRGELRERDVRFAHQHLDAALEDDGNRREHAVLRPGKQPQYPLGVRAIGGLAQDLIAERDGGVGDEHGLLL